jgi:hypothetical protein
MARGKKYFNLYDWLSALRTGAKAFLDVFVPLAGTKDLSQKLRMFERLEPRAMLAAWGQVQAGQLVGADGKFSDAANWWDGDPPTLVALGHAPGAEDLVSFEASGKSKITIDSNQTVSGIAVTAGQTTLVVSKTLTVSTAVIMQTSWLAPDPGPVALTADHCVPRFGRGFGYVGRYPSQRPKWHRQRQSFADVEWDRLLGGRIDQYKLGRQRQDGASHRQPELGF